MSRYIELPTKHILEMIYNLIEKIDLEFMRSKKNAQPFSKIAGHAIETGLIKEDDRDWLYRSFTRVQAKVGLFRVIHGEHRHEYWIEDGETRGEILEKIRKYAEKKFKTSLFKTNTRRKRDSKQLTL